MSDGKNIFSEYGPGVNMQELFEDLAVFCAEAGVADPSITIILPKRAQEYLNTQMMAKERIPSNNQPKKIRAIVTSGVINILNSDEHEAKPLSLWAKFKLGIRSPRYGKTI